MSETPKLSVQWNDTNVSLFTMDGLILARSKDSEKGKVYEYIAIACDENALLRAELAKAADRLEQAARWFTNDNDKSVMKAAEQSARAALARAKEQTK